MVELIGKCSTLENRKTSYLALNSLFLNLFFIPGLFWSDVYHTVSSRWLTKPSGYSGWLFQTMCAVSVNLSDYFKFIILNCTEYKQFEIVTCVTKTLLSIFTEVWTYVVISITLRGYFLKYCIVLNCVSFIVGLKHKHLPNQTNINNFKDCIRDIICYKMSKHVFFSKNYLVSVMSSRNDANIVQLLSWEKL